MRKYFSIRAQRSIFSRTYLDTVMQLFELVQTLFELFECHVQFIVIPRQLQCVSALIDVYIYIA